MRRRTQAKATGVWEKVPGSGIWWIRYRVDGKLKREKVGRKSDAIALYQQRKSEIRAGKKLPDNLRASGIKFSELAKDILSYSEKHHRDTRNVSSRLERVLPSFGTRPAESIKPAEIDSWLALNCTTAATANRYRSLFSLVFREALRNGKVTANPARLVRQRHENNGVIRWLTDDEEKRLRNVIDEKYPHRKPDLIISLGTGMRLSEQYGLTWNQVDFVRKEIRLSKSKNNSGWSIPLNAEVFAAFKKLEENRKERDTVFEIQNPKEWFHSALRLANIANYRWHDNRHTFCSRLAMRGVNLKVIQALAGHKTIGMTARYAHLDDAALRRAVDELLN
jgi:integrase